jgi:hypothetical protein
VVSSTSPYSVPDAVTAYTDGRSGNYVFEVKYIGTEEPLEVIDSENSKVERGKNSKRLYKVAISDLGSPSKHELFSNMKRVITSLVERGLLVESSTILTAIIDENENRLQLVADTTQGSEGKRRSDAP